MTIILMSKKSPGPTVLGRIDPQALAWIQMHHDWTHNRFPFGGGLYDQPARYLAAMRVLDAAVAAKEMKNREKAAKQTPKPR